MVEKKIKALIDFQFTNFTGTHYFTENEVKRVKFINLNTFREHLKAGWMVEAAPEDEEGKIAAVVYPPETEVAIVSVNPVDPIEGIEPEKLDLPCPPEDHIEEPGVGVPENLVHDELSIEEVVSKQEDQSEIPELEEFSPGSADINTEPDGGDGNRLE